ncbi:MAG: 3-ketoacyl-ACP reductase [Verrucomicrobia bacterium]|nr:MAG: 3-ketoacyl-ACP reductase [Verrucomicrobiota bacterium]
MKQLPVVLVTGASRGLGRGIAQSCARSGFSVAVHFANNENAAKQTVTLCQSLATSPDQRFIPVRGDLSVSAEREEVFRQTLEKLGGLDALVNNAGMAPRQRADLTDTSEHSYEEVMAVNLKGPYFLSQLAARHWLAHPGRSLLPGGYKLIFVTSISAETASVNRGEYCLSKAGLAMAAQLWAARLAREGVQVFEIRPGIMATDMTAGVKEKYDRLIAEGLVPQMRWGAPEDVGLAVEAVLRGSFPYSTGNVISVDGGFHLRTL